MQDAEVINFDTRISQIEKKFFPMIESLKDRIYTYDKLIVDMKTLKREYEDLLRKNSELDVSHRASSSVLSSLSAKVEQNFTTLNNQNQANGIDLNILKGKHENLKQLHESSLNMFGNSIDLARKDFQNSLISKVNILEHEKFISQFNGSIKEIRDKIDSYEANLKAFKDKIHSEQSALVTSSVSNTTHYRDLSRLSDSLDQFKKDLENVANSHISGMDNVAKCNKDNLNALRHELDSKPSEIPRFKEEINKKIDNITQENQKFPNFIKDMNEAMNILDSKIENTNLLLRKLIK